MMNKKKSPMLTLAKYLLIFPLALFFMTANSVYAARNTAFEENSGTNDEVLPEVAPEFSPEVLPEDFPEPQDFVVDSNRFPEPPPVKKEDGADKAFEVVEVPPQFPGGMQELLNYIKTNIKYPAEAHKDAIQGRVIVKFIVSKDGSIKDVNVIRRIHPLLDEEAVRVVQDMPKWIPGQQKGENVNVYYTLPLVFRLDAGEKTNEDIQKTEENMDNFLKAEFPGGENALLKYFRDNVRYPVIALENGIQGHVSVVCNVGSNGKVSVAKFDKSVDPSLDREVKRVIESMPDWTPAKQDGKAVGMTSSYDFIFRIQGEEVEPYTGPTPENAIVVVGYAAEKKSSN